jgi:hypothetical protein
VSSQAIDGSIWCIPHDGDDMVMMLTQGNGIDPRVNNSMNNSRRE